MLLYMVGRTACLGTMRVSSERRGRRKGASKHGLRILRSFRGQCTNGVRSFDSALRRRTAFLRHLAVAGGRVLLLRS